MKKKDMDDGKRVAFNDGIYTLAYFLKDIDSNRRS